MYCAIGFAGSGVFFETTERVGACAHGVAHFEVVGVAVDKLPKGFARAVVLFGLGIRSTPGAAWHRAGVHWWEIDDELLKFPRCVAIHAVVKNADCQFKMRFFVLGALGRKGPGNAKRKTVQNPMVKPRFHALKKRAVI